MKKGVLILSALLLFSIAYAESDTIKDYSFFEKIVDNVRLFFSLGESRVNLFLEIKAKEVNSAIFNAENGNLEAVNKSLESAQKIMQQLNAEVSLSNAERIRNNSQMIINAINRSAAFNELSDYALEEENTILVVKLFNATFDYCKELARTDYNLMLKDSNCNPATANFSFQEGLDEYKMLYEQSFNSLMLEIRSCIDDPGTCSCDNIDDANNKIRCEKMVALAIKCEYGYDNTSCDELEAMKPSAESGFAESFVPEFLLNLFVQKSSMIEYNIEKSDVPEQCYDENNLTECEQYQYLKETHTMGSTQNTPTMKESIPQCYDNDGNFMEEECGKVIMVRNENGLINYIIEKQLVAIIDSFENKTEQNIIEINGTMNRTVQEMERITNEIKERVYASGTTAGGSEGRQVNGSSGQQTVVVEGNGTAEASHDVSTVVIEGEESSPEIGTVVVEGN